MMSGNFRKLCVAFGWKQFIVVAGGLNRDEKKCLVEEKCGGNKEWVVIRVVEQHS